MTALTRTGRPQHDASPRPVPWRRMVWVTWRQHRAALAGMAVFLGAFAVYLWLTGLQMRHAEAAYCHPAGALGCAINFTGRYGETAIMVSIALQAVPALVGAFVGAPVLARELETGTFRFAWTQGIGRLRWTVGKLVPLAVVVAAVAGAFTVLFAWYTQPWAAAGYVIPFSPRVFDLLGVAFAAWALAAFAWQRDSRHRQAAVRWPLPRDARARPRAPRPARLHPLDQLPARQPVLALPVDRRRLAARAVGAAHRRHRLAGPPPRRLIRPWHEARRWPRLNVQSSLGWGGRECLCMVFPARIASSRQRPGRSPTS
jgi:hypothetical protein